MRKEYSKDITGLRFTLKINSKTENMIGLTIFTVL